MKKEKLRNKWCYWDFNQGFSAPSPKMFRILHSCRLQAVQSILIDSKTETWLLSRVWLFVTPWMVAHQYPLSLGFSRQEYWSGLPFSSPGALPDPGLKPGSYALQAISLLPDPLGPLIDSNLVKFGLLRFTDSFIKHL